MFFPMLSFLDEPVPCVLCRLIQQRKGSLKFFVIKRAHFPEADPLVEVGLVQVVMMSLEHIFNIGIMKTETGKQGETG